MKYFSTLKEKFCISVQPCTILSVFFCLQVDGLIKIITIIDLLLLEICTMQFLWKYSAAPYKWGRGEGGVQVCVRGRGVRGSTLCYLRLQTLEKLVI